MSVSMHFNPLATSSSPSLSDAKLLTRRRARLGGLALVIVLAWAYMIYLYITMPDMTQMAAPNLQPWTLMDFVMMFVMWSVMMAAMMLPSALPTIWLYAKINQSSGRPINSALFVCGYLALWTAFSLAATLMQWALHAYGLLSAMDATNSPTLGGAALIMAGIYQWLPYKRVCLNHCRSPLAFLMTGWRKGARGALAMGLHHGAYCVGCCWALMLVLFVVGTMNLLWIALIALYVLLEKWLFSGEGAGRWAGVALIIWGFGMLAIQ
jgi:predicted metal-binding membrane protein